jgi:elongation factor G
MLDKLRNIGIIAHVDAGKTTTSEGFLFYSGAKHKPGAVDAGTTTTGSDPIEQDRGITINSAAVTLEWGDHRITVIDTPGHVDFTAEVERSLRVLDGAVGIFCAVGGVEVQSETVWFQANRHQVPRLAFVNKMDRPGANFRRCVEQMVARLGVVPAICALPVGEGKEFGGVIDLVEMKFVLHEQADSSDKRYSLVDLPETQRAEAEKYRQELLAVASRVDDRVLELLLEDQPVPIQTLRAALRKGTLAGQLTPIFCGSAKVYQGVPLLLDGIVDYLPSPSDRGAVSGLVPGSKEDERRQRRPDRQEPFAALAFKTVTDVRDGDLFYLRVYSGELHPGEEVLNATVDRHERVTRLYRMMGARRLALDVAGPGEIVAVVGLRETRTGHTLCAPGAAVLLEEIRFPEPVISVALLPNRTSDERKLAEALARLVRDDPTLKFRVEAETSELILSGMGELHLQVSVEKLQRTPGIGVSLGKPRVAYRQTLAEPVEVETRYIKQAGGPGKYAVIRCRYEPLTEEQIERLREEGAGPEPNNLHFASAITGGAVPKEYIPSVAKGFREACKKGARHGFPCVDVLCTLLDGQYHEKDSSTEAFFLAAQEGMREAQARAGITLLEPIMHVVVVGPDAQQRKLIGDISRRRGEIRNFLCDGGRCEIRAHVPLAELFGYTSDLRNVTSGTASFSMEPSHYAPVKEELADLR